MSESQIYVACTCFRDGLTSEPPVPRDWLGLDAFGNVTITGEASGDSSPAALYDWRCEDACEHLDMRLVDRIYYGPHRSRDHPVVEATAVRVGLDRVVQVLRRGTTSDAEVFVTSDEAATASPELQHLLRCPTGIRSRVLTTPRGSSSPPVDRDSYDGSLEFTRVATDAPYPDTSIEGVTELGVEGLDLVVRDCGAMRRRLSTSRTLQVFQGSEPEVRLGGSRLHRTLYLPGEGAHPSWGLTPRLHRVTDAFTLRVNEAHVPNLLAVQVREQSMADLDHRLRILEEALTASVATGNPVVSFHNGSSLGFAGY